VSLTAAITAFSMQFLCVLKSTQIMLCCVADLLHPGIVQCDKRKSDSGGKSQQGESSYETATST
jgi:hypothetical protein